MRRIGRFGLHLAAGALALALLASPAGAKVKVELENWGLGGRVKPGLWSTLYLQLVSDGQDFKGRIEVRINASGDVQPIHVKDVQLVRDTPAQHWVCFRAPLGLPQGGYDCAYRVVDEKGREAVRWTKWQGTQTVEPEETLILLVSGAGTTGLDDLSPHDNNVSAQPLILKHPAALLPDRAIGYDAVDALVWINPDTDRVTNPAQQEALENYVVNGGHLVIATSGSGNSWKGLPGSFLGPLLPAQPAGTSSEFRVFELDKYEPGPADVELSPMALMTLTEPKGDVLMRHGSAPLVVARTHGAGRVTLIGFDPRQAPFTRLKQRGKFWADVLRLDPSILDKEWREKYPRYYDVSPISRTLIRPLDDFPGFTPINFSLVFIFLIGYIAVVGPVDYFVLKSIRKLHWTWVTFPSVAILASILAFGLLSSTRVAGLYANSISIANAVAGEDVMTGMTYMTLFSPADKRYDVGLENVLTGTVCPKEYMSDRGGWAGGIGRSECDVRSAEASGVEQTNDMRVRIWTAQTMEARWRAEAKLPEVTVQRAGSGFMATIKNQGTSDMQRIVLLNGGRVYELPSLAAGASTSINGTNYRTVASYASTCRDEITNILSGQSYGARGVMSRDAATSLAWATGVVQMDGRKGYTRSLMDGGHNRGFDLDVPGWAMMQEPDENHAILMYTLASPPVRMTLAGESPLRWDAMVVRMIVPITNAEGESK